MKFAVPLKVKVSKNKHFILNLNNYRNAHHRVLSTAKRNFTDYVLGLDLPYANYTKIKVHYCIFPASNRKFDGMNVISVIDKFLMDALIKRGMLVDDNINHVVCPTWVVAPVDRINPRCEVFIEDLEPERCGGKFLDQLEKLYPNWD